MSSFFNLCGYRISCSPKVVFTTCIAWDGLFTIMTLLAAANNIYGIIFDPASAYTWLSIPSFALVFLIGAYNVSTIVPLFQYVLASAPVPLQLIEDLNSHITFRNFLAASFYVGSLMQIGFGLYAELGTKDTQAYHPGDFRGGIFNFPSMMVAVFAALPGACMQLNEPSLLDSAELLTFRSHKEKQH